MDGRSVAITVALILAVSVPGPAQAAPPAGSAAPPVSLSDRDGRPLRLADLLGRVLVVDFWASWCGPCKESFPALDGLHAQLHEHGLEVLAVSVDESRKDADAFLAAHPHRMTVLFDPQAKAAEAFGVDGMPSTFVIDRQGRVRSRHEGWTPGVTESIRRQVETLLAEKGPSAASASPR